ncbi:MAG: class A beta-lactamase-related serine hydrolase [Rhodothermia bacterium]|nr:class A beta-lactamase-related serine hydrolase [Rhodothermia bacterium]
MTSSLYQIARSLRRAVLSITLAILACCPVAFAQPAPTPVPALPLAVPDSEWEPLREQLDPALQTALEARLKKNAVWSRLLSEKRMAVSIVDLSDRLAPRFANVNGDVMMYAASLPKIAILLAAAQQIEDGTLEQTPDVIDDLNAMIRKSSNPAATRMINRVGGLPAIETVLTDPRYKLFDPKYGGGLWVGKRYAKSGRRNPDPLQGLSHAATSNQVGRFYYLVAEGRLVSREQSKMMLDILADPGINHKFVNTLSRIAPRAKLYRKSGSWRNWHSDSVLVWGPEWRRYIVVCLVEDENGERIIRNLIPAVESVLKPVKGRT